MNWFAGRDVFCGLTVGWLLSCCCSLATAQVVNEFDHSDQIKPIHSWRILTIDPSNRTAALDALGNREVLMVSQPQLERLFSQQNIDPSTLLKNEIDATVEYAEKRESELKVPAFAKNSSMREEAELHRSHAKYLSGLTGKLAPYLVRAKFCSKHKESGLSASINLRTGSLKISQGCLSRATIIPWVEPVVVLSEVPVTKVEASVSVDE